MTNYGEGREGGSPRPTTAKVPAASAPECRQRPPSPPPRPRALAAAAAGARCCAFPTGSGRGGRGQSEANWIEVGKVGWRFDLIV